MTSNWPTLFSGLGMGLLIYILQGSILAFIVCVFAAGIFVIALWRRDVPVVASPILIPRPTWESGKTNEPSPTSKREWLIPKARWRGAMLGGAALLFVISVVMGLDAISERQKALTTKEEIRAWKDEMLAELRANTPVDDPVDPSIEHDLVAAVDRLARAAESGELAAKRALKNLEPSAVVDYLDAQRRKLELSQQALNTSIGKEKIALNYELAAVAYTTGRIDEAQQALERILKVLPDDLDAITRMGHIHELCGRLDDAESSYRRILALAGDDESVEARAYGNLGNVMRTRGDLDGAETMYRKALEINEKLGRLEGMAGQYGNLGNVMCIRGDLDGAEAMYRKALKIDEKLGRLVGMSIHYSNLGSVMFIRSDFDGAEAMYGKSLEIDEKLGRLDAMAACYGNLGNVMQTRGDPDGAEAMYRKALKIDEKLGRVEGMANHYGNLGVVMKTRGDLDGAEAMYRKALEIDEKLGRLEGMAGHYGNLGNVMCIRGDLNEARKMWTKSVDLYTRLGAQHMVDKVQGWIDNCPNDRR